jgi:hypothetical protein
MIWLGTNLPRAPFSLVLVAWLSQLRARIDVVCKE